MKTKLLKKLRKRAMEYVMVVQMNDGSYGIQFERGSVHILEKCNMRDYIEIVDSLRSEEMDRWVENLRNDELYIQRIVH